MVKDFEKLNYYELLDIKPGAAPFEIRQGYSNALQIYSSSSMASYSFFTEAERKETLFLIEKAYHTLINDQTRQEYNEILIREGVLEDAAQVRQDKKTVAVFQVNRGQVVKNCMAGSVFLKEKIAESDAIRQILTQNELCGADLKKIRELLDVPVEQIAQESRVRADHLKSIEEDNFALLPAAVFLKGFVKAYLKCLCVTPEDELASRYMETIARRKN